MRSLHGNSHSCSQAVSKIILVLFLFLFLFLGFSVFYALFAFFAVNRFGATALR